VKKKVGEEAARHWINGMRSIASNVPISPFHLAAADDMESLLEEVLLHRKKKEWVGLTAQDLADVGVENVIGAVWADAKLKEKNGN